MAASSTDVSYFFLSATGRLSVRKQELVASEERERRERWEGNSLRPSLVNYLVFNYICE